MTIQGAVIEEQGVTFAIVVVKKHVVDNKFSADEAISNFSPLFPGLPLALAAQDHRGHFTYYGRQDISKFLASIDARRIPWKEYTVT